MSNKTYSNLLYAIGHFVGEKFTKVSAGGGDSEFANGEGFQITNDVGTATGRVWGKGEQTATSSGDTVKGMIKKMLTKQLEVTASLSTNLGKEEFERGEVVEVSKLTCALTVPGGCKVTKLTFKDHNNAALVGTYGTVNVTDGNVSFNPVVTANTTVSLTLTKPIVFGKKTEADESKAYAIKTKSDGSYDFESPFELSVLVYWQDNTGTDQHTLVTTSISWPLNTYFYGKIEGATATYGGLNSNGMLDLAKTVTEGWVKEKLTRVNGKKKGSLSDEHQVGFTEQTGANSAWFIAVYPARWMQSAFDENGLGGSIVKPQVFNDPNWNEQDLNGKTRLADLRKWSTDSSKSSDEQAYKEDYCVVVYGGSKDGYVEPQIFYTKLA